MKYSTARALIIENFDRSTIRTLAAYGYDNPEQIIDAVRASGTEQECYEYLEELADDCYLTEVPEIVKNYFDYEAWTRDLLFSGDYSILKEGTHYVLIDEHA